MRLSGKVAIISGAASGMGAATARMFAREGAKVVIADVLEREGRQVANAIGAAARFETLDVTSEEDWAAVVAAATRQFGKLDVLVNNAGVLLPEDKGAIDVDLDTVRKTFEVNVVAALALSQAMIPLMRKNGGKIINISSTMACLSEMDGGYPAYRISKTALNALTRVLAAELAGSGIQVNSMSPGWVRTDMGGTSAPLSVQQGADTVTWLATLPDDGPTGGFFRERKPIAW